MIDQTLTTPPDAPSSNDIPTFRTRFDAFIAWIVTFVSQLTTVISQINSTASTINSKESSATSAASTATTQAGIATTKAGEANASATAAYNAQLAAEAVFDNFDDKYLGAKATAPTVDNDGNPLVTGALFFKTTAPKGIYVYDAELAIWSSPTYVPTSHGSLSGRSDADSHPMSAINGLIEALLAKAPLSSPTFTGIVNVPVPSSIGQAIPMGSIIEKSGSGIGYGTGSGGNVTQLTSKSTSVTLNKHCGMITMNNAALAAGASVTFVLYTSAMAASSNDLIVANIVASSVGNQANYSVRANSGSGGAYITLKNESAGSLSEAVMINFAIIKGATA